MSNVHAPRLDSIDAYINAHMFDLAVELVGGTDPTTALPTPHLDRLCEMLKPFGIGSMRTLARNIALNAIVGDYIRGINECITWDENLKSNISVIQDNVLRKDFGTPEDRTL